MTAYKHSPACCSISAIATDNYEPKGKYIEVCGMKTYCTGPSTATSAILIVYDIFGFASQTLQGADILTNSDPDQSYQVFVVDFMEGGYAEHDWIPTDTPEKSQKLNNLFEGPAAPGKAAERVKETVRELERQTKHFRNWMAVGFCWGGKIVSLTSGENSLFKAVAVAHPAMIDVEDAVRVTVPFCILASKDEDPHEVKAFEEHLRVKSYVETFSDQVHGWMAARADLTDARVLSEYRRGYSIILQFFHDSL